MLVVNYNGNKPISNYFKYGVEGNNNVDIIRFVLLKNQSQIDLSSYNKVSVKVRNDDNDFVEEIELDSDENVVVSGNTLFVDWHLESEYTTQEQLEVSLCFTLESGIWQTQLVKIKFSNGIVIEGE